MRQALLHTDGRQATLLLPSKRPVRTDNLPSHEYAQLLQGIDVVVVAGTGWARDPKTKKPTIQNGHYALADFLKRLKAWERKR
jgi:hypothetical protein